MKYLALLLALGCSCLAQEYFFDLTRMQGGITASAVCASTNAQIPVMATDSTNGIVLSASSLDTDGHHFLWSPVQGFIDGNGWAASDFSLPQWWQIQFPYGVTANSYALSFKAGAPADTIDIIVSGSNNGSTFVQLVTNTLVAGSLLIVTNNIPNSTSFTYYRLTADNWQGPDQPQGTSYNYVQIFGCP